MLNSETESLFGDLEGLNFAQAQRALTQRNYVKLGGDDPESAVFRQQGSAAVLRLFHHDIIPHAMETMFRLTDSRFLPSIYGVRSLSGDAHILSMEALRRPEELTDDRSAVCKGYQDAFRSFLMPDGEKDHTELRRIFWTKGSGGQILVPVMHCLAAAIHMSIATGRTPYLCLNTRPDTGVLLRPHEKGRGYEPVFVNPLAVTEHRADALAHLKFLQGRLEESVHLPDAFVFSGRTSPGIPAAAVCSP